MDLSKFDWKSVVRTVAPALATALGTPLAGVATKVITDVLLGDDGAGDVTDQMLEQAVRTASPDQLIALKQAGMQFEADMAKLGVDLERLANEDRASARRREVETGDIWTPRALAAGVTAGYFGVLAWLLAAGAPPEGGEALLVMLGSLGTAWIAIISYFYGSSAGSKQKNDLMSRMETRR